MATIDNLDIQISASVQNASKAINQLIGKLNTLATSLKFDTSSLEKLGNINGNNFKKLGEGLQSFANAAKSLSGVRKTNFNKLADGIERIANIDSSKLEALGKIDGNSFRGLGEGVKALSAGLKDLQGVKKSDFNRLASGIERLATIQPGNMEAVGNALRPLADGIKTLSTANFDNKNLQNLINSLTRLANANVGNLANADFITLGNKIKELATALSSADKVEQNTISMVNAIAKLSAAGANVGVAAAGLPELGKKLKEFMDVMSRAKTVEADTIAFTQAIAQLASAGSRIKGVADNLVPFGEQLKKFFDIMSKAPTISDGTIRLVQALAQLAGAGGRANVSTNILNRSVSGLSASMAGLKGSAVKAVSGLKSFARQALSAMGIYIGIYGAVKGFQNAIKSSMDYVEVLNYFDAAFGQVAQSADLSAFEQLGYDSADAYYNSFAERAQELTAKMSGFTVGESGLLQSTGMASLGMDPSQLMNYQAMFGQMSSSMGVSSETALKLSQALTEIGADLASVKNMDFEKVWEDMASGLAGMSRTLDKYGVNIRNVNLQQKLNEIGIKANISALNQNDKALLRAIILLDSTRYAWGDLADTINQPANQLRLIEANFKNLSRTIGSLFLPIVQTVLPYVNALVIALQRLFAWLASIMGVDLSGVSSAVGGMDIGGFMEDAEGASGALGSAAENAKKLKTHLLGIDELNVVEPDTGGGSNGGAGGGIGGGLLDEAFNDALEEYQKVWDEAFANMENRAQELADRIGKIFEPIKKLISGDFFGAGADIGSGITNFLSNIPWNEVYQGASKFGSGLAEFLNGLISPELFGEVGKTIAGSLNTALHFLDSFGEEFEWKEFGDSIAAGVNNFFATFDFALLADTINTWANGVLDSVIAFLDETEWEMIGEQIGTFLEGIDFIEIGKKIGQALWKAINAGIELFKGMFSKAPIETTIIGVVASIGLLGGVANEISSIISGLHTFLTPLLTIFSGIGEILSTTVIPFLTGLSAPILAVVAAIAALVAGLGITYATNEDVRESFSQAISAIKDGLQPALEFVTDTLLPDLSNGWDRLMEILSPLGDFLSGMFVSIWQDMINPALRYVGETVLPKLTETFENLWNNVLVPLGSFLADVLKPVIQIISDALTLLWQYVVVPLADAVMNSLSVQFEALCAIFNETVVPAVNWVIEAFQFLWDNVLSPLVDFLWEFFEPVFEDVFKKIGGIIDGLSKAFSGLIDFITGIFTRNWEKAWGGIKDIFNGIFNALVSIVEGTVNIIIDGLNFFLDKFNGVVTSVGDVIGIDISIPSIPKLELPRFEKGGITLTHTIAEISEFNRPEAILPLSDSRAMGMIADSIMENADYGYRSSEGDIKGMVREVVHEEVSYLVQSIAPYLGDISHNTRETANKDMSLNLDGRELIGALDEKNQSMGFNFGTGISRGRVAF